MPSGIKAARKVLEQAGKPPLTEKQKGIIKRMDAQIERDKRLRKLKTRARGQTYGRALTKQVKESREKKSLVKKRRH